MKNFIDLLLSYLNIKVTKKSSFDILISYAKDSQLLQLLKAINSNYRSDFINYINDSKSELGQDLFVLSELKFKKKGFFVEFGATNGIDSSNTYLLEKNFNWNGILAEPAKIFHEQLKSNRKSQIDKSCIWNKTGEILNFSETKVASLSTISSFSNCDAHTKSRKKSSSYLVETISLEDLLKKFNAPNIIDYLSIDTEGSEFEILNNFNFNKYKFRIITCEHNGTLNREKIYDLLIRNGYKRKFVQLSKYDDWYYLDS